MKNEDNFPNFSNGVRIYKATPSTMRRRQKWNWSDIPVGSCMEIEAKTFPAETKIHSNGSTNVGRAAYAYARNNNLRFTVQKTPCGNVLVFNRGLRNELI